MAVANSTSSLDIICTAEPFTRAGVDGPAWCTDWSTSSTVSSLVRRERIPTLFMSVVSDMSGHVYHASGPSTLTPIFAFIGPVLEVAGLVLDTIKSIHRVEDGITMQATITEWLSIVTKEAQTEKERGFLKLKVSLMEKFWSMLAGDATGVWSIEAIPPSELPQHELQAGSSQVASHFRPVCVKEDEFKHTEHYESSAVFGILCRGRTLIITEDGLMGLVPHYVEVGQKLAILSKWSVPVVLEENQDGTYKFRGGAFVQG